MKKLKVPILITVWIFVYALILFFMTFSMARETMNASIYLIKAIIKANIYYIITGYIIILNLLFVSKAIFKNTFISNLVVTIPLVIISIISYYKSALIVQPFVPTDILLIGNLNQIAEFGLSMPPLNLIYCVIVLAIILALQYIVEKKCNINYKVENWKKELYRIPLFLLGIVVLFYICIDPSRFERCKVKNDLGNVYTFSGPATAFFIHLGDFYFETPKGYSKGKIDDLQKEYSNTDLKTTLDNNIENQKANVILIMNESFSDPTKIKDVEFSIDPLIDIKNLAKNDINAKMGGCITPVIGGGTSLPEFEAITGLSSFYLEKQIFPYISYIRSDMNSLVREYNKNGYETLGLHTNTKTFYNRQNVYKFLGFKETIFAEDIENPEHKAGNISDNEFKNQIINKFENSKGTNKFIFGVTMQNHMPYERRIYGNYDINVTTNKYNEQQMKNLINYTQGVYDSTKMYMELVEYLKKYEEPTILVMFGDHLPSLSEYIFYDESDYTNIDYFETPYIIWSNYGADLTKFPNNIIVPNLGLSTYELGGNELPWYLQVFKEIYQKYMFINNQFVYDRSGKRVLEEELENDELINNGAIIQYELLIKKKHILVE